jgi:hypothetical protein
MKGVFTTGVQLFGSLLAAFALLVLLGCAGGTSQQNLSGQLAVSPSSVSFGNVAVGQKAAQTGTLSASNSDITVSSAAWNGQGYSISGITFPVTVPAGKSASFTITFAPPTAGTATGSVTFDSNASNSTVTETLSGTGTQTSSHSVALSWNASTSLVAGYNIYRGTQPGGPYTRLTSSPLSGTSYTDASVQSGATYYYVSTAINSGNVESAYSNQATAAIP